MEKYYQALVDQDPDQRVICNLEHIIVYENKVAIERYGNLVGKSIFDCHNEKSIEMIKKVVAWFQKDKNNNRFHTFYNAKHNRDVYMMAIRDTEGNLIGYYEKHEYRTKDEDYNFEFK